MDAADLIRLLELVPLPVEGGYFRRTYTSAASLIAGALSPGGGDGRPLATAIYYLVTPDSGSRLHRLQSDEIYHFYLGSPVEVLLLKPDGSGAVHQLGPDIAGGQTVQLPVPAGVWQGCALKPGGRFALMGTTMSPGFHWDDFQLGDREELLLRYPSFADLITKLAA